MLWLILVVIKNIRIYICVCEAFIVHKVVNISFSLHDIWYKSRVNNYRLALNNVYLNNSIVTSLLFIACPSLQSV